MALSPALQMRCDDLLRRIADFGRVAVAFSGGVDSSVVAKAAQLACGADAVALTAVSASLASGERELAARVAEAIGIRHRLIETSEFDNPDYRKNAPDRCFFCKDELYRCVEALRDELGFAVMLNGANADDRGDHRPGMQAARNYGVDSPLLEVGFTKADVRAVAREWDLPVWDKPASPCLSSRVAYGLEVTPERVSRVDRAERFLRGLLGAEELRVRHEANDLARIEVAPAVLPRLAEESVREAIAAELKSYGFRYVTVDLEGFRSGSLNAMVPADQLRVL